VLGAVGDCPTEIEGLTVPPGFHKINKVRDHHFSPGTGALSVSEKDIEGDGHCHRNSYGEYRDIKMITTGPVGKPPGSDPFGLRIVMEAINTHTLALGLAPYRYGYVDARNLLTCGYRTAVTPGTTTVLNFSSARPSDWSAKALYP
jgi:hypothetical protein